MSCCNNYPRCRSRYSPKLLFRITGDVRALFKLLTTKVNYSALFVKFKSYFPPNLKNPRSSIRTEERAEVSWLNSLLLHKGFRFICTRHSSRPFASRL
ncbi:unnamed protein product [Hermetia illucens]|uniref:Uncharacterized protein n=1 Tax=Hermetia illucens TaxID=343691 RepID=A0A7R8V7C0_HERIL|nr:unnamed protein product [Hermetia illucens]